MQCNENSSIKAKDEDEDEDEVVVDADAEAEARRFCEKFANFSWRFCIRAAAQDKVN